MDPFLWIQQNPADVFALTTGLFLSLFVMAMLTRKPVKKERKWVTTETQATIHTEREL